MWTRPDWEIYGPDGRTLWGRGSSLAASREDMQYRAEAWWRHMQGMGGFWGRRCLMYGKGPFHPRNWLWR